MKKLLSFVMAVLCMLPCGSVKAVTTEPLPDGGKVLTYSYDELPELIEKHEQLLSTLEPTEKAENRRKSDIYHNISTTSIFVGVGLFLSGTYFFSNKEATNKKTKNKNIALGTAMSALGVVCCPGITIYSANAASNILPTKTLALEKRIFAFRATKECIDRHIQYNICSLNNVQATFYYRFFVDKNGTTYKVERGGARLSHAIIELSELNQKYKFPE